MPPQADRDLAGEGQAAQKPVAADGELAQRQRAPEAIREVRREPQAADRVRPDPRVDAAEVDAELAPSKTDVRSAGKARYRPLTAIGPTIVPR